MTKIKKTIELSNVRLLMRIGVHEFERQKPQVLMVSIAIRVRETEEGDDIENTLDYDPVYDFLKSLEKSEHFDLQETVCRKILKFALAMPDVEYVEVSTRKTDIFDDAQFVGVTMSAENNK